jgi:hypothetical protein
MLVRGDDARALCEAILYALDSIIPPAVDVSVPGQGRHWAIQAKTYGAQSWISLSSLGAWPPFLPRSLSAKLAMLEGLELIQDAIAKVTEQPWPHPGYKARAQADGQHVRLWFENASKDTVPVGRFPMALAG